MLGNLGKLIVAKGFKKLPKVQKIARSGHTGPPPSLFIFSLFSFMTQFINRQVNRKNKNIDVAAVIWDSKSGLQDSIL